MAPQFHFHWNRTTFVWNNSGDRVYLRPASSTARVIAARRGFLSMKSTRYPSSSCQIW